MYHVYILGFNELLIVLDLGLVQDSPEGGNMFLVGVLIYVDPNLVSI